MRWAPSAKPVTFRSAGATLSTSESKAPSFACRAVPLPSPGSVSTKYSAPANLMGGAITTAVMDWVSVPEPSLTVTITS